MLEATFRSDTIEPFTLFVVHLKSRYTNNKADMESAQRREREARACRDRILDRTLARGGERFMVAGDFNDHPSSSTMRRFYRRGDVEIGALLPAADSRGEVWTYFYKKRGVYSLVDGFVLSPSLMSGVEGRRGIVHDTVDSYVGSDHRMVYFDIVSRSGSGPSE